jgi:tRNA threonylcarbamoyladenosine biosynthesis protein TsaB
MMSAEKYKSPGRNDHGTPLTAAIETATRRGSLALLCGEKVLFSLSFTPRGGHSAHLMPAVEELSTMTGIPPSAWSALVVSSGPGSFTGLRIGLATAKAITLGLRIPLYGVPTLDALALRASSLGSEYIGTLLDARKGQLFAALYRNRNGSLEKLEGSLSLFPEEVPSLIPGEALFTGDGLDVYGSELQKLYGRMPAAAPPDLRYPDAVSVARMGLAKVSAGAPSELGSLVPEYVRASDAEIKYGDSIPPREKDKDLPDGDRGS